ncbi:hypothetical protein BJ875DRAFT_142056 [Amylocarpus encephaloides]|uniref:DUF7605 domain-containing protein n=1 Tax=Amylocarpus encephaloides TaxID=45428 RepID=A0A9P7YQT2_9HELO|nr:hypothetical protein BJ875DRAFT_142056 [Amylocarpus encephaloides]
MKIKDLNAEMATLKKTKDVLETKMSAVCIEGRNKYSKDAIQLDFAAGIKELDQENAQEEDEENFDPDDDIRDYENVAKSLPVFCVSSRAYQKLSGRMQRDNNVPGFRTTEETEIPQLKAHCKKLTEGSRATNCRRFLTDLSQTLNSLAIWASDDGAGLHLPSDKLQAEARFLKNRLQKLDGALDQSLDECLKDIKATLADNIFGNFPALVKQAADEANSTAVNWGDRTAGGYYWSTYKALCRRNGIYSDGSAGPQDLNEQLTAPIIKGLGNNWERVFARKLPIVLASFSRKNKGILLSFHREIKKRILKVGLGVTSLAMLGQQLRNYEESFANLSAAMAELINAQQLEVNRDFGPSVAEALAPSYEFCAAETGPGQFVRMKHHMNCHVDEHRMTMFQNSVDGVQAKLNTMCRAVHYEMGAKTDEVWSAMNRDYIQAITGTHTKESEQMPKWERLLRADIAKAVRERDEKTE